jgi:hypothetical protein
MTKQFLTSLGFSEEAAQKVEKVFDEGIETKLVRKASKQHANLPRVKPEA